MSTKNLAIVNYLENYILSAIDKDETQLDVLFSGHKNVTIEGSQFNVDCWAENTAEGKLYVIELSRKKCFFVTQVNTMGLLINGLNRKVISQAGMWDLGMG
jgi:hypothetical protein